MTADDLTRRDPALLRRAIIAAHDAEHPAQGSDDVSTYPPLTKREAAIVEAWRADVAKVKQDERHRLLSGTGMSAYQRQSAGAYVEQLDRAEAAEAEAIDTAEKERIA